MAKCPLILAAITLNYHVLGKDVKSTNPIVYCPCLKKHALVGMEISFHATTRSEITALCKIASFDKAIISLK